MASAGLDFGSVLRVELARIERLFAADELAFLALTSKIELPIRDRLAYALFRRVPELRVTREWRRVDLAVLSPDGKSPPVLLLEAKALYTFDLVGEDAWVRRYPEMVQRDLEKLRLTKDLPSEAQLFSLILATHPTASINPGLQQVAKYSPGVSKAVAALGDADAVAHEADRTLRSHLGHLGAIHHDEINAGEAYGVPLAIHYWLVGPVDHSSPARSEPVVE
jgi:hypothetical protein